MQVAARRLPRVAATRALSAEAARYALRMTETPEERESEAAEDEAPAPTPFDHPMFMPALLFAFALWFGYDGFLNDDPDMLEHQMFNRVGFGLWLLLLAYYGYRGLRELREGEPPSVDSDRPDPID